MSHQPTNLQRALVQQLESLRAAGVRELPKVDIPSRAPTAVTETPTKQSRPQLITTEDDVMPAAKTSSAETKSVAGAGAAGDQASQLTVLQQEVSACTLCNELASTRTQTVFGVGNPDARVVFFGEAPGADEDRQGEPFVGRAGQLLTKIIAACTWSRDDVYILNTLKCRPPGNRNPAEEELTNCRPYWKRQLEIIQPEFIVCLGKFAMQEILQTPASQSVGKMRHKFHPYEDENVEARVVVTYHPSYLLRNPAAKKDVWGDMKMLLAEMGIEPA